MADTPHILVVAGLGLGDEGKGATVDALVRRAGAGTDVVRYNGGPQAAHHVVQQEGGTHCFAQLGSGSLVAGAATWLSRLMVVDPLALEREAEVLAALGVAAPLRRVTVDERCVVVTPLHRIVNRIQEVARGAARHGSCGKGVGQALLDSRNPGLPSLRVAELRGDAVALRKKLRFLQLVKIDQAEQIPNAPGELLDELRRPDLPERLAEAYAAFATRIGAIDDGSAFARRLEQGAPLILEGAQGVLLDAEQGFWPHVTPSCTTFAGAGELLGADRPLRRLGVLRAYATRHGAGPLVTHDPILDEQLPELHNVTNPWQGAMRVGWLDLVATRYALAALGAPCALALTCMDRLIGRASVRVCDRYAYIGSDDEWVDRLFVVERRGGEVVVRDLRLRARPTHEEQGELTRRLEACRPIYDELPGWSSASSPEAERFVEHIATRLSVEVEVVAWGPTAADRHWCGP